MNELVETELFNDSLRLNYDTFQIKWRNRFTYIYDARYQYDQSEWCGNCLKVNDGFFALYKDWRSGALICDTVKNRYLCLLERSYLRRLLKPDTNADELFWNLYEEVYAQGCNRGRRIVDNSDNAINQGMLKGIAERVMIPELDWIASSYKEDIGKHLSYWQQEHPNGIIARGPDKREALKTYTFTQVSNNYDWNMTQKENSENLGVSTSYLRQNNFGTREMMDYNEKLKREAGKSEKSRSQQYRDRKKAGEVLSRLSYEESLEMYPEMKGATTADTKANYESKGYQVSIHTICKMNQSHKTVEQDIAPEHETNVPSGFGPIPVQTPNFGTWGNFGNGAGSQGW